MEELNTITNDMKETEELFSYIDQCIIELESEDGEMINQPLEVLLIHHLPIYLWIAFFSFKKF